MTLISKEALDLIVTEEVTSRKHYEAALSRPTWPGLSSGVTIGIGYDVGAGVTTKVQLWDDWKGVIPDSMIIALERAIGVTGSSAKPLTASLRSKVNVPWDAAVAVFEKKTVPKWYATCKAYLPNYEELSLDCKGALLSLTYNRGPSFNKAGDRYKEMRNIKAHMTARRFSKIPVEIKAMKRIWAGTGFSGLLKRRDREAALFDKGLKKPVTSATKAIAAASTAAVITATAVVTNNTSSVSWQTISIVSTVIVLIIGAVIYFLWRKRHGQFHA